METTQASLNWAEVVDYAKRYNVQPPKTQYQLPRDWLSHGLRDHESLHRLPG